MCGRALFSEELKTFILHILCTYIFFLLYASLCESVTVYNPSFRTGSKTVGAGSLLLVEAYPLRRLDTFASLLSD